jgi:Ca2+-dependent lipid-binding protein
MNPYYNESKDIFVIVLKANSERIDAEKTSRQINACALYLQKRYKIPDSVIKIKTGLDGLDFIKDKFTIKIEYHVHRHHNNNPL